MPENIITIQPDVLKWAREKTGYSAYDIASKMGKDVALIKAWEAGKETPTYVQLEKLAYHIYKRPIAIFFFPEPPDEPDLKKSFRTLPEFEIDNFLSDTRYALRCAQAMQIALMELNDGINSAEKKVFADIKLNSNTDMAEAAAHLREYFGVKLDEQTRWPNETDALKNWREYVEHAGIFVFKRSFKQKDISGFSIFDKNFPIIYLNNSNAKNRQIFSLFHELAHILFQENSISMLNDDYIDYLPSIPKRIEHLCNQFAGEFLVPSNDFDKRIRVAKIDDQAISSLADYYRVSREVILRKFLDRGLIKVEHYKSRSAQWAKEFMTKRPQSPGGDYYATQATYLGNKYLELVFGKYYQGRLTVEQVADYLGVKSKSVPGIEHILMSKSVLA